MNNCPDFSIIFISIIIKTLHLSEIHHDIFSSQPFLPILFTFSYTMMFSNFLLFFWLFNKWPFSQILIWPPWSGNILIQTRLVMSSDDKNFTFWKKSLTNCSLLIYFESQFVSGYGLRLVTVRVELLPAFKFTGKLVKNKDFTGKW